jgi:hypothetical protein
MQMQMLHQRETVLWSMLDLEEEGNVRDRHRAWACTLAIVACQKDDAVNA